MLIFLKLGGSLITDKTQVAAFRAARMAALAQAIQAARVAQPDLQLLVGHGSGSFGHVTAKKHGTMAGVQTSEQWQGFAEVGRVARLLNQHVTGALAEAGVPVWPLQPSASAECNDGVLHYMDVRPIQAALARGLVPLVHGDVALDKTRGGTIISTESIFFYLAPILQPQHVFLAGEVAGVLDNDDQVFPQITPATLGQVQDALHGSHGVDVTGGMASKVQDMVRLAESMPFLSIHILSGIEASVIAQALIDPTDTPGTVICS